MVELRSMLGLNRFSGSGSSRLTRAQDNAPKTLEPGFMIPEPATPRRRVRIEGVKIANESLSTSELVSGDGTTAEHDHLDQQQQHANLVDVQASELSGVDGDPASSQLLTDVRRTTRTSKRRGQGQFSENKAGGQDVKDPGIEDGSNDEAASPRSTRSRPTPTAEARSPPKRKRNKNDDVDEQSLDTANAVVGRQTRSQSAAVQAPVSPSKKVRLAETVEPAGNLASGAAVPVRLLRKRAETMPGVELGPHDGQSVKEVEREVNESVDQVDAHESANEPLNDLSVPENGPMTPEESACSDAEAPPGVNKEQASPSHPLAKSSRTVVADSGRRGHQQTRNRSQTGTVQQGKIEKSRRDSEKPVKNLSPYGLYSREHRESTAAANPNYASSLISDILRKQWKTLNKKDRKMYEVRAAAINKGQDIQQNGLEESETESVGTHPPIGNATGNSISAQVKENTNTLRRRSKRTDTASRHELRTNGTAGEGEEEVEKAVEEEEAEDSELEEEMESDSEEGEGLRHDSDLREEDLRSDNMFGLGDTLDSLRDAVEEAFHDKEEDLVPAQCKSGRVRKLLESIAVAKENFGLYEIPDAREQRDFDKNCHETLSSIQRIVRKLFQPDSRIPPITVLDAYQYGVPKFVTLLIDAFKAHRDLDQDLWALQELSPLTDTIVMFAEAIRKWEPQPEPHLRIFRSERTGSMVNLRKLRNQLRERLSILDAVHEQKGTLRRDVLGQHAKKRAARHTKELAKRNRELPKHEQRKLQQAISERNRRIKAQLVEYLEVERIKREQQNHPGRDGSFMQEAEQVLEGGGEDIERVNVIPREHQHVVPSWDESALRALLLGLEKFTGHDRYVKILGQYGGSGQALEQKSQEDVFQRAVTMKNDMLMDQQEQQGWPKKVLPAWLESVGTQ